MSARQACGHCGELFDGVDLNAVKCSRDVGNGTKEISTFLYCQNPKCIAAAGWFMREHRAETRKQDLTPGQGVELVKIAVDFHDYMELRRRAQIEGTTVARLIRDAIRASLSVQV